MKNKKKISILSLDGGGVKGIITAIIISEIEKRISHITKNPNYRITDDFELIAGSSTGSILASIITSPSKDGYKFTINDAINFYVEHSPKIFKISFFHRIKTFFGLFGPKYDNKYLKETLNKMIPDIKLSELKNNVLLPTYDMNKRNVVFFTRDKKNFREDFFLKDIILSCISAITYFKPNKIFSNCKNSYDLMDGGVNVNNPSMCALIEAVKTVGHDDKSKIFILSIGTGKSDPGYPYDEYKNAGGLKLLAPAINIMMSGQMDVSDYQVRKIYEYSNNSENYIRVNLNMEKYDKKTWNFDNGSKENIEELIRIANHFIAENISHFNDICEKIISFNKDK